MWALTLIISIVLWSFTSIFYKKGADKNDPYVRFRFSIVTGIIFFVIAVVYLIIREESFSIWESMIRFWPITLFSLLYPIINTITYRGFLYNETAVNATVENTANGSYVIILVIVYLLLGRVNSIWEVLNIYKLIGIACIFIGLLLLGIVQNKIAKDENRETFKSGASALIFPLLFSLTDGLETIVTGVCLDKNFGYAMPEGDAVIIVSLIYAIYAFGFWIYLSVCKHELYNPFTKENKNFYIGALCDNVAIVFYAYAMSLDSVSTDPILAIYPVLTVLLAKVILKEELKKSQLFCILLMITGSILMVVGHAAS